MVKIPKKINNEAGAMYCFINIFSDFIIDDFMFKKNSEFSPILKKSGTLRVWVNREKFNIDFLDPNFFLSSLHV